ncbi:MAG: hypothetical protein WKG07_01545 [Hymenobacter sp.]
MLPIAIQARKEGFKGIILPKENAAGSGHRQSSWT